MSGSRLTLYSTHSSNESRPHMKLETIRRENTTRGQEGQFPFFPTWMGIFSVPNFFNIVCLIILFIKT